MIPITRNLTLRRGVLVYCMPPYSCLVRGHTLEFKSTATCLPYDTRTYDVRLTDYQKACTRRYPRASMTADETQCFPCPSHAHVHRKVNKLRNNIRSTSYRYLCQACVLGRRREATPRCLRGRSLCRLCVQVKINK